MSRIQLSDSTMDVIVKMSEGKWEEIVYPEVSGRAMMIYRNAFLRHDMERFDRYLMNTLEGKEKIHAETLYLYFSRMPINPIT